MNVIKIVSANRIISPLILIIVTLFFNLTLAYAADWKLKPQIGLAGGYDDNILFHGGNKVDSSFIETEPAIDLDFESLRSSLNMAANWDILNYFEESDLDQVNHYYSLNGNYQLSQRWNARAGFRYKKDSTLNSYLEEVGRVIERLDRDYMYAMGGISYNLSTVSSIVGDYIYEQSQYEDDTYPDFDRHRINLRYRHRLNSQQDVLFIGPSYYHRVNDLNEADYFSVDFGWERDWSDITKSIASIGARYAKIDYENGESRSDWGVRARLELTSLGLASITNFRYYHDVDTTAAGSDINIDNFYLKYEYLFTERFGIGIEGRLIFSYNLLGAEDDDDDVDESRYFDIRPFLRYRLTKNFNISLSYGYQNSSQDPIENTNTRERNRVWLRFYYEIPVI